MDPDALTLARSYCAEAGMSHVSVQWAEEPKPYSRSNERTIFLAPSANQWSAADVRWTVFHELGHIAAFHVKKRRRRARLFYGITLVIDTGVWLVFSLLIGSMNPFVKGFLTVPISLGAVTLLVFLLERFDEYTADAFGLAYGLTPELLEGMLARSRAQEGADAVTLANVWYSGHPTHTQRVNALRRRIARKKIHETSHRAN